MHGQQLHFAGLLTRVHRIGNEAHHRAIHLRNQDGETRSIRTDPCYRIVLSLAPVRIEDRVDLRAENVAEGLKHQLPREDRQLHQCRDILAGHGPYQQLHEYSLALCQPQAARLAAPWLRMSSRISSDLTITTPSTL